MRNRLETRAETQTWPETEPDMALELAELEITHDVKKKKKKKKKKKEELPTNQKT